QLVQGPLLSLDIRYPVFWRAGQPRRLHAQSSRTGGPAWPSGEGAASTKQPDLVNAGVMAVLQGMHVVEEQDSTPGPHASMVTLEAQTEDSAMTLGGRQIRGETHILRVNDYEMDIVPSSPYLLFIDHQDRPGMIGTLGMVTGNHDINIAFMAVARRAQRGKAMMVLGLDDPVSEAVMEEIRAIPHITSAKLAEM
ncbi:MAG: ACT domain-containing protein, partial [Dehalococcoidia bacterium]